MDRGEVQNFIPLRRIAECTNVVVRWTEFGRGGRFSATEEPDSLIADIGAFFRRFRTDGDIGA